jgi:hypothetical protein
MVEKHPWQPNLLQACRLQVAPPTRRPASTVPSRHLLCAARVGFAHACVTSSGAGSRAAPASELKERIWSARHRQNRTRVPRIQTAPMFHVSPMPESTSTHVPPNQREVIQQGVYGSRRREEASCSVPLSEGTACRQCMVYAHRDRGESAGRVGEEPTTNEPIDPRSNPIDECMIFSFELQHSRTCL